MKSNWKQALALRSNNPVARQIRFRLWVVAFGCTIASLISFHLYDSFSKSSVSAPAIDLSGVHADVAQGINSATQVVNSRPESGLAWGHLGMTLWAHEYASEALKCFAQAQRLSPNEVRWPYFQGIILTSNDRDAAEIAFSSAARCTPETPLPLIKLCEIQLETDKLDEANFTLNHLLELAPNNAQVYLLAAILADRQGRLDQAIERCQRSFAIASDHSRVISLLARLLNRDKRRKEAETLNVRLKNTENLRDGWPDALSEEISTFRLDPYWSVYKANQQITLGNDQQGITLLRTLVEQFPDEPTIRAQLVRTLLNRGMTNEAMTCLTDAADSSNFELRMLRATTHLLSEEWEAAEIIYRQLLKLKPDNPSLLSDFAFCLRQGKRFMQALAPAQQAANLAPDQVSYRIELIRILIQLKRLQRANHELAVVKELAPTNDDIRDLRQAIDDASR